MPDFGPGRTPNIGLAYGSDAAGNYNLDKLDMILGNAEGGIAGPAGPAGPEGPAGPAGVGVPAGGTTGQVLQKVSDADFDVAWVTLPV
jgi:hypothetical protein